MFLIVFNFKTNFFRRIALQNQRDDLLAFAGVLDDKWIKEEEGRFADVAHPPPKMYPDYGYMQLESWGPETQRPVCLYQHDVDAMAQKM